LIAAERLSRAESGHRRDRELTAEFDRFRPFDGP